jgi:hypothetical protein
MVSHVVFLTKLGFENLKNLVTPSPFRKVRGGGMPKYDPTTKLIILRRSPKTSLWDSCDLNLHTNTVYREK